MYDLFINAIRGSLMEKRISVRSAAMGAGIPIRSFQSVLDGRVPSIVRAEEICKALDLEFYIGPPRGEAKAVKIEPWSKATTYQKLHDKVDEVLQANGEWAVALKLSIEQFHGGMIQSHERKKGKSSRSRNAEQAS